MKLTVILNDAPQPVTRTLTASPSASLYDVVVAPNLSEVCAARRVVGALFRWNMLARVWFCHRAVSCGHLSQNLHWPGAAATTNRRLNDLCIVELCISIMYKMNLG